MATLLVNSRRYDLLGLGRNKAFQDLSKKRVTKAVRNQLRESFGHDKVKVSCEARFHRKEWTGVCRIGGEEFRYRIFVDCEKAYKRPEGAPGKSSPSNPGQVPGAPHP
jgi:hypothetical protein